MNSFFRMPVPVKINGRSSSITNSFINRIIPCIHPSDEEVREVLEILGMDDSVRCAYCGDPHTEWDHFRPLVKNKRPTGYISEIQNLVPACGKCNQSKGNSNWRDWILSEARLSPFNRGIKNITENIGRLDRYEKWSKPTKVNFEEIIDQETWEEHWRNCERIHNLMRESQVLSDQIRLKVQEEVVHIPSVKVQVVEPLPAKSNNNDNELYDRKVGIIAQTLLKEILVSGHIPDEELKLLTTSFHSKKLFNLGFPLLRDINHRLQIKDEKGRNRYYAKPITIKGRDYFMCSQWYEPSKLQLIKWIELNSNHLHLN